MTGRYCRKGYGLLVLLICVILSACGQDEAPQQKSSDTRAAARSAALSIVSGSENKELEPLIQQFAREHDVDITITYMGSIDMTLMLSERGADIPHDAVWPANSLWISLGDRNKVVRYAESIMRSPVVLGVKKPVAERLGWIGKDVTIADILDTTRSGSLRFTMTSATQSNSGASAYLGFLHAMAGSPDILSTDHLENAGVREKVKTLLSMVDRSSGSSGWLKSIMIDHYDRFQAMFNYEAMIIEANQELVRNGRAPLYAIYPTDGIMIADSPLGYVDKGDKTKESLFQSLQAYLLSETVQKEILKQGRRTGLIGLNPDSVDHRIFNPDWGIDVSRIISPVPTPPEPVIQRALDLYQTVLRKPSLTAYVVDISGSMQGKGIQDLKAALSTLFDPDQARRYMLQPSAQDIHIILPFNAAPLDAMKAVGNSPETLRHLTAFVQGLQASGGTDIYAASAQALEMIKQVPDMENYFPAVILMTDGRSSGNFDALKSQIQTLSPAMDIPVFSITFGNADERQLKEISTFTAARVFNGTNLVGAFREAKGYN